MNNEPNRLESSPPKKRRAVSRLVALCAVLGLTVGVFFYGSVAADWVRASQFTPTKQLAGVAARIDFSDRGQQIFYATAPAIQEKVDFNKSCTSTERTVAILGCYYLDRIYLYNINNAELDGTLEVTAAHEMLHAAYHRLNYFERRRVDAMVSAEYEKVKNQPEISQTMQYYKTAEPGAELDELHSIIGTTLANLPSELERYYAQYFDDRAAVVALNAKYNEVFSELNAQADELQKKIDSEGQALKADTASYQIGLTQLNFDIKSFNDRADAGAFRTQSEFTTARAALERRVAELDAQRTALNARVDAYNAAIEALNKLAVHANQLNESMNGVEEAPNEV